MFSINKDRIMTFLVFHYDVTEGVYLLLGRIRYIKKVRPGNLLLDVLLVVLELL